MARVSLIISICLMLCLGCSGHSFEQLAESPPRGLALLHLMEPAAGEQPARLVEALHTLKIDKPALAVLVDGSFGFDEEKLFSAIELLNENDRQLHLLLYLTNGASQRRWKTTEVPGFAVNLHPDLFNDYIQSDGFFQAEFLALAERILPAVELNKKLGGITRIVPGLEDNFTDNAFGAAVSLLQSIVPEYVEVGRNPCPGCFPENGVGTSGADFLEVHYLDSTQPPPGGVWTNDGAAPAAVELEEIMLEAERVGAWFLLWQFHWQGLQGQPIEPADRNYEQKPKDEDLIWMLKQQ